MWGLACGLGSLGIASTALAAATLQAPKLVADDGGKTSPESLKASVATLKITKGRSQIIKFAQPIMRVSIAEPSLAEIVPLSADQLMINGKQRGVTSLIVWDKNGQEGIFDLVVQNDTTELLDAFRSIAPNEKLDARITDDSFVLSGQASNSVLVDHVRQMAAAYGYRDKNFIDLTESETPQVSLKVRIIEVNKSLSRDLKTTFGSASGSLNISRLANPVDLARIGLATTGTGGLTPLASVPGAALNYLQSGNNLGGLAGAFRPGKSFQTGWDLLEDTGKVKTLAEPTLVVTHGRTADFLAGGEYPYTSGTDRNGSPLVSFKEYGVKLKFTPWVSINGDRIELKIEPEVSMLDKTNGVVGQGGTIVYGVSKRSTSTTVDLKDNETFIVSGILSKEDTQNLAKIPFIGDIPILGALFKNSSKGRTDDELMVVVTPHIVQPHDQGPILGGMNP